MNYQPPYWRCPYCMGMQNTSGSCGQDIPAGMPEQGTMPSYGAPFPYTGQNSWGNSIQPPMPGGMQPRVPTYMQRRNMPQDQQPLPYYQAYGFSNVPSIYQDEQEYERDMQRLKEMYPDAAKKIMQYVEEECDKMEYDGSVMFEEQPDRVMLLKIINDIYDKVQDQFDLPQEQEAEEVFTMNVDRKRRPPRKNWLGDMVQVLLLQEMHRRRCRHRNCKRWY